MPTFEQRKQAVIDECENLGLSREEIIECANSLNMSKSAAIWPFEMKLDLDDAMGAAGMFALLTPPVIGALGGYGAASLQNTPYSTDVAKELEKANARESSLERLINILKKIKEKQNKRRFM